MSIYLSIYVPIYLTIYLSIYFSVQGATVPRGRVDPDGFHHVRRLEVRTGQSEKIESKGYFFIIINFSRGLPTLFHRV